MEQVAKAPSHIAVTPRNPDRTLIFGGRYFNFGQVASPPNVMDLDQGRRVGVRADFQNFLKLAQAYNCIQFSCGYPVEPMDLHPSIRHLDGLFDKLTLTDKVVHAYALGTERIEDAMEMVRIAAGLTHEAFDAQPRMFTNINSTSPLKHDWPMLDGAMRMATRNQMVVVSPFTLAGAMAPVTLAGALALQNAEGLAAIALLQAVRTGAPVMYGAFTSNVDMKTGAPAFGTREFVRAMQISGQLARFYGLPLRASNANAANALDAQAVWESAFSLQGSCSGGANLIYHAAGWMEGGSSASFEKFIIDCEMLQQIIYTQHPIQVDESTLAVDAIAEVGPHGHFLAVIIPSNVTATHFTHRCCRIGGIMKPGWMMGVFGRINVPLPNKRRFWRNMLNRQWIRQSAKNLSLLSIGAKPRGAQEPIFNAEKCPALK